MSRIKEAPFDAGGTHSLEKARNSWAGPGQMVSRRRWCFKGDHYVQVGGGRMVGSLWKCVGCSKPKETA